MRIVIYLPNEASVFRANSAQIERLRTALSEHTVLPVLTQDEFLNEVVDGELAMVWDFEAGWYQRAPKLRWVCTPAAGRERVAADPAGRATVRHGSFHGKIMAEALLGMVLFMNRRLGEAEHARREKTWDTGPFQELRRLRGQTLLIIGYGAIGRHAAGVFRCLGVHVHGLKRSKSRGTEGAERIFGPEELHPALALADHVACILPGDTGTDRLLDAAALARMKPGSYLYNLGRGNAIDLDALTRALASGTLAGAFLDVFPREPLDRSSPLWSTPHLYITPHASAMAAEYLDLYFEELVEFVRGLKDD